MPKQRAGLPREARWVIGAIAVVVLGLAIVWVVFVPAADWLAHHDVGSVTGSLHETAVDNARGRLLTLGAGLFAAGALIFTARNFTLSREGQVTDRYTKAIEQLGSDKLDVRIGGIYALERIASDSARDHPTVIEVLSAFIREHSREPWPPPGPDGAASASRKARPDVQAALTVVGRRDDERDIRPVDLSGSDLRGAQVGALNLRLANLRGVNLAGTSSRGQLGPDFSAADLGEADLRGADLFIAILRNATLDDADLRDASFRYADLRSASLRKARLAGADLRHADLRGADLGETDLVGADLDGVQWDADMPVPAGWALGISRELEREDAGPPSAEAN